MKNSKVIIIAAVALIVGSIAGYALTHRSVSTLASPVGTTFSTAKIAAINMVPATPSATSTSVYNGDDNARFIESAFAYCTGVGASTGNTTAFGLTAATTTTNAPAQSPSTAYAANFTIGTSTAITTNASSSYGASFLQYWPAATYLTFFATATNTAACTVGVHYIGS